MIAAVDVDGVIADLHPEWLRIFREETGFDIPPGDLGQWDFPEQFGLNEEQKDHLFDILRRPKLYSTVEPIPGAVEAINRLKEDGWTIYYVTSCINGTMVDEKVWWLREHGFIPESKWDNTNIPHEMIVTSSKHLISADVMIDDRPWNLLDFPSVAILYDQPYNKEAVGLKRMAHWRGIATYLQAYRAAMGVR